MKSASSFFVFCFLFLLRIHAQDSLRTDDTLPHHATLARVSFSQFQSVKTHIMAIKDSSLFIYQKASGHPDPFHKSNIYIESQWEGYNYRFIESVKVTNKKLRAWLVPVSIVAGVTAGVLIGINAARNDTGYEGIATGTGKLLLGALLGGVGGTAVGLIISSANEKKYLINGDWKSFEELKAGLKY
jgi:hypothetical protein